MPADRTFALSGRVVTMDRHRRVFDDAVVYVGAGSIVDVRPPGHPPPGFEQVPVVDTGGTIFPGLVELHNHLPYDVLSLWQVPKPYQNRDQWSGPGTPEYHQLITGPMQVLGAQPQVTAAVVRFVEMRCLLGGTTTSQGVTLAKTPGLVTHFRGLVRNVEKTDDARLPTALTHIADVVARDGEKFLQRLGGKKKLILHLSEGVDAAAHNHFAALQLNGGRWAITGNLIGIHCVALTDADFNVFGGQGGSMVWSPLSNLLLYGATADVAAAIRHNVPMALGSDWAPSGSKNLLGELKVARAYAAQNNLPISSGDLVAMVTSTPADMLGWGSQVGSLAKQYRADVVVAAGRTADPYQALLDATEADLALVMIEGTARVGTPALMKALGATAGTEQLSVGGRQRTLDLTEPLADASVARLSMAEAIKVLRSALRNLPTAAGASRLSPIPRGQVRLAVEGLVDNRQSSRPHLPYQGIPTGPNYVRPGSPRLLVGPPTARAAGRPAGAAAEQAALGLKALKLDPLAAVDNPGYYDQLATEPNLPAGISAAMAALKP